MGHGMASHPLEDRYGLSALEMLAAINSRFRLRVAVEGAVAEVQMERHIRAAIGTAVERYEAHDVDGYPDFSLWIPGRPNPLLAECKNIRESGAPGGEAYRRGGKVVAYKVETQKTRAAKGDPTSRYYDIGQYNILGVCLGKKTGNWADFLFARTVDLARHKHFPHKLAVFQRVPLPDADDLSPWYIDLAELLRRYDDAP